ncbi:MAG: tRNA pseudouridine(38-40) synthase TruA [Deltaproteobacteria bacterium]|nr:tRNA pseudouridine(38-40) synthase TruA [Deltaproteobacteria bacterium]
MRNIKLLLEYDGTGYAGWQTQPGVATVQGALTDAVEKLTADKTKIIGASRTDAGVHAIGQVANFLTPVAIPLKGIMGGLNLLLPHTIAVKSAVEAPLEFDSRKDAKSKTYIYRVFNRGFRTPLFENRYWSVSYPLGIEAMKRGAELLVGKKDFSSFMAARNDAGHPVREVLAFRVDKRGEGFIDFEVKGTAFLRHMVRIMVGMLVTLGRGKIDLDCVSRIIEAKDRRKAPVTAPPQGLVLKEVEY